MKRFIKIFGIFSLLCFPFTAVFFYYFYKTIWGIALGLVSALIAGLTVAHIVDDFLSLRESKINKLQQELTDCQSRKK